MTESNADNRLKCSVHGNKVWEPVKFHEGKDADGNVQTTDGFKNLLTNQEVDGSEPPYSTGDARGLVVTEAYRRGYDLINWEKPDARDQKRA
jgi:hypothetical protein